MKKLLIATAVAATLFAPQAFAQAKNFEGFSVGGNLNFASGTTEVSSTITNLKATENSTNADFIAQYNFGLGNSFVLGLGVSAGLGNIKGGNINGVLPITFANNASVFIAPGFAISDTTQIYGKLAAISSSVEYGTVKLSLSGTGVGAGVQTFINKNMFITGQYMVNTLEDKKYTLNNETDKFSFNTLSIGIGYKF